MIDRAIQHEPHPFDEGVTALVRTHTPPEALPALQVMSRLLGLGGWLIPLVAGLLALAARLWRSGRRCESIGLLVAIVTSSAAVGIARRVFARARPEVEWALGRAPGSSFPSGHAASAVVYFGMLAYLTWKLTRRWPPTLAAAALALFVSLGAGYSRIYLGVHYPSDVAAGYLVGAIWLATGILTSELLASLCQAGEEECARTIPPQGKGAPATG